MNDTPLPAIPVAAIPSRAVPPAEQIAAQAETPVKKRKKRTKKAALPSAEIKALNAKRAKAKKARINRELRETPIKDAMAPKQPNRPLEMKNKLAAVLHFTNVLTKPEMGAFVGAMEKMETLSRGRRRRVIQALAQVYP